MPDRLLEAGWNDVRTTIEQLHGPMPETTDEFWLVMRVAFFMGAMRAVFAVSDPHRDLNTTLHALNDEVEDFVRDRRRHRPHVH